MRNLKKFLALVLAMMMTLSLLVVANAAPATPTDFTDLDKVSPAYAEAVNVLSALKIIKGDDGFRPGDTITRAEVSAMLYRIAHNDADESQVKIYKDYDVFPDVQSDKWYAGSVNYCANAGYLKGYPNGSFGPSNEVTGYEVLVMTLRMLGYGKNGEFEGKQGDWRLQAAMYGRKAGLTKQIKEGTLGQPATREMVAEIMFQALQADLVDYNLLQNYYPSNVLIADNEDNRAAYANAIAANQLTLPLNGNLMYANYGIVGKTTGDPDPFGRPTVAWVKDNDKDDVKGYGHGATTVKGRAGKYIVNSLNGGNDWEQDVNIGVGAEDAVLSLSLTPVATYSDAIDECHLTKDVNNDTSIFWMAITEVVNGEVLANRDNNSNGTDATDKLDALHTSTQFIGATGRTTEIYKLDSKITIGTAGDKAGEGKSYNEWIFVYIDTFLGEVTGVTEEVKDTAGHTIIAPKATVEVGGKMADSTGITVGSANAGHTPGTTAPATTDAPVKLTLANPGGKYKVGDLVLVQTPNAGSWTNAAGKKAANDAAAGTGFIKGTTGPDAVTNPEKAPLNPEDVPMMFDQFFAGTDAATTSQLLSTGAKTVRATVNATVGARDAKMGIITTDGKTYMASNTFLASRTITTGYGNNTDTTFSLTVLPDWYDVDVAKLGITNSMIGRTFDLVLDQNDHIIGLKEVLTINSNVGVITSVDAVRVSGGKYMAEVEAYMSDKTTQTFRLFDMNGELTAVNVAAQDFNTSKFQTYGGYADVDADWTTAGGEYSSLGVGSLVMFKQITVDGINGWYICDFDTTANQVMKDKDGADIGIAGTKGTGVKAQGHLELGGAAPVGTLGQVATGVTGTLSGDTNLVTQLNTRMLDDSSVIFVAEYEYRYNTSGNNDGANINKTYQVYEGFKKMPTITGLNEAGTATNILYQQLAYNTEYVLVYAQQENLEYTIKNQDKITVDDSYLVLSRGATYAAYSEYNVLKNGVQTTLQVSNANTQVNKNIEATMASNKLLLVTGRNAAGYVTSVGTVSDNGTAENYGNLTNKEIITGDAAISYADGVLKTTGAGQYLTLDDNVKVQLVNRDQKTVTEISLDVAMVYATNKDGKLNAMKNMVFELNELGYVCNLYVIE